MSNTTKTAKQSKRNKKEDLPFVPLAKGEADSEFLLMEHDPKYRKPRAKKAVHIPEVTKIEVKEYKKGKGLWWRLRPIVGFVISPYLLLRPVLRFLSGIGNELFDRVFYAEA